ncbi:hypothetical protein B0H12DRAFT_1017236, partial [Mycena haematopus]
LIRNLADSFVAYLDDHNLRYFYRYPADTKIADIAKTVANAMTRSPRKWIFTEPSPSLRHYLRSETPSLHFLGPLNRGIPRPKDNCIGLIRQPTNNDLTLADLFSKANQQTFTKPKLCFRQHRLILNFANREPLFPPRVRQPRSPRPPRRHSCLPELMHSLFSPANETSQNIRDWVPPDCDSGGETDDEMEAEQSLVVSFLPVSLYRSKYSIGPRYREPPTDSDLVSAPSLHIGFLLVVFSFLLIISGDHQLWTSNWVPEPGRYVELFIESDFPKAIFETASSESAPTSLRVSGQDVTELAFKLIAMIKHAATSQNFTRILSSNRTFNIDNNDGSFLSTGVGIEREVVYTAFSHFTSISHQGIWLLPRFGDRCSIATTMSMSTSSFVNPDRLQDLAVLGCLTALMIVHGLAPEPLSPALIQFVANKCNLQSLTRAFVGEWFPELKTLLESWIAMGPTGDVGPFQSHFAIYHDIQAGYLFPVASLQSRNSAQHEALATHMLYTALIGREPASHSELKAFVNGFRMPCSNGFDFAHVLRSAPGGSSSFISRTWTSMILDFNSLKPYLDLHFISRSAMEDVGADATNPVLDILFPDMLYNFLKGTGIPCPSLFEEAKSRLSPLIPLDDIDLPSFRSKALCWAATGSPHIELDKQIIVHLVHTRDEGYHSSLPHRLAFMKAGTIRFQSCFRTVRIPALHLIELGRQSCRPLTLQNAIENWLFIEILAGIGSHTIL